MDDENPATTSASPKLEDSVEVEPEVKEEQDADEDEDAPNEPEENEPEENEPEEHEPEENELEAPSAVKSGDKVTNPQYKALKDITETLTNHKITRRGDECVEPFDGYVPTKLSTYETQELLPFNSL